MKKLLTMIGRLMTMLTFMLAQKLFRVLDRLPEDTAAKLVVLAQVIDMVRNIATMLFGPEGYTKVTIVKIAIDLSRNVIAGIKGQAWLIY